MKTLITLLFYIIAITGCNPKNDNSSSGSSLESSSKESSQIDLILDPENYNLVIFESKETILESFKEKLEQEESLSLSTDDKMTIGEAALTATIATGFAAGIAATLGSVARVTAKKTPKLDTPKLELPSLKKWELPSGLLSATKEIEIPDSLKGSLGLNGPKMSEKKLAEATLDKLESGKSLSFSSRNSAENLKKLLLEKFPSPTREMDVIEVNGKFHLVGWNTELKLESSPLVTIELSTKPFSMDDADLWAKKGKDKDFIFIVDPSDSKSTSAIEEFEKFYQNEKVSVMKMPGQTKDGKDIYILTNKALQERLSALNKVVNSKEKIQLGSLKDKEITKFKGVLDDVISTRKKQMTSLDNITKTILEYLSNKKNNPTKAVREQLEDFAQRSTNLQRSLSKNLRALNPDDVAKFLPRNGTSVTLTQKNIDLFQKNFLDPNLLKKYRDFTFDGQNLFPLLGKNVDGKIKRTRLGQALEDIFISFTQQPTTRKTGKKPFTSLFEQEIPMAGFQSLPRVSLPLGELPPHSWVDEAKKAARDFTNYVNQEVNPIN